MKLIEKKLDQGKIALSAQATIKAQGMSFEDFVQQ